MNGTIENWRPLVEATQVIPAPRAYVLDETEEELAALLARHGIAVERLTEAVTLPVASYRVDGTDDLALVRQVRTLPPNTFVVPLHQPASRLLATLLEPWSQDGWYATAEGPRPLEYSVHRLER
jgi:hypothetical protein